MNLKILYLLLVLIIGVICDNDPTQINGENKSDIPSPSLVTPNPTTSSTPPDTTTTSSPPTTSSQPTTLSPPITTAPSTTTGKPITTTTTPKTPSTETPKPSPTSAPTSTPTNTPAHKGRHFDGPSFIGGIILAVGLMAICFVSWKFYKARTERNYHTL